MEDTVNVNEAECRHLLIGWPSQAIRPAAATNTEDKNDGCVERLFSPLGLACALPESDQKKM